MKAYRKITIIWIVFCVGFWFDFSQPHWFLCEEIYCLHRVTNVRLHCFIFDQKWAISSVGWSFPLFQSVVFFFFFSLFFFWVFFSYIRCMRFFIRFFPIHLGMVQCTVKIRKTICIFEACNHRRVKIELIISSMCGLQWNYSSKSNVPLYWISMKSTMIHSHSLMSIPHQIKSCPELKRWFYLLNFQSRFTFRCSCFFRVNFNSTDWISDFNSIISHYSHFILCIQNEKKKNNIKIVLKSE